MTLGWLTEKHPISYGLFQLAGVGLSRKSVLQAMLNRLKKMSALQFENLTYDLLAALGLENAVWRTPGRDGGRDIEGVYFVTDLSGHRQPQKWYVECKKYATSIAWPTVREKISYAESHDADYLLMVTTSNLSPQAIDETNSWNALRPRPKVRVWPGHSLVQILQQCPEILVKYGLTGNSTASVAVSLLPLSVMTLKFTQAAYAESIFRKTPIPALETAAAMADLSTNRLEQMEAYGTWTSELPTDRDLYHWVHLARGVDLSGIDRYAFRAILCAYKLMSRADRVTVSTVSGEHILIQGNGQRRLDSQQKDDVRTLARWGNFDSIVHEDRVIISQRTAK